MQVAFSAISFPSSRGVFNSSPLDITHGLQHKADTSTTCLPHLPVRSWKNRIFPPNPISTLLFGLAWFGAAQICF
jgi:hypothetical protein